jgi:alcohol dehydrogenase (cytochrome c)
MQNTGFSRLAPIDASNVARLQLAWTFSTGRTKGHEAAPVVVGATMLSSRHLPMSSTRWI